MAKVHSFTRFYNGRSRVLEHDIEVCIPDTLGNITKAIAVWDTGATNTVINQRVVDALGLQPVSFTKVHTASQKGVITPVFLVDVFLKHDVRISKLKVTRGELEGCDCLLGMDIIALGDFAVTNYDNQTCVTFRIPSQQRIDFVQSSNSGKPIVSTKEPGRNDPCSCGSGKKFKHCHGKKN